MSTGVREQPEWSTCMVKIYLFSAEPRRQRVDDHGDLHPDGGRRGQVPDVPGREHAAAGRGRRRGPVEARHTL